MNIVTMLSGYRHVFDFHLFCVVDMIIIVLFIFMCCFFRDHLAFL